MNKKIENESTLFSIIENEESGVITIDFMNKETGVLTFWLIKGKFIENI
jgi:hypothetical protein